MHRPRRTARFSALIVFTLLSSFSFLRADDSTSTPAANSGDNAALSSLVMKEGASVAQLRSLVETLLREDPDLAKALFADSDLKQLMTRAGITRPDQALTPGASDCPATSGTNDDQRTARAELAQAQAMADAALASRAASDSSDSTGSSPSAPAASGGAHYTTGDLVNSASTLGRPASDATHHSMSSLVDGP